MKGSPTQRALDWRVRAEFSSSFLVRANSVKMVFSHPSRQQVTHTVGRNTTTAYTTSKAIDKMFQRDNSYKAYHIDSRKRRFLWLLATICLLMPVFFVLLSLTSEKPVVRSQADWIGMIGLSAGLGAALLFYTERIRLIVSAEGIEYQEPPIKIKASWDELGSIAVVDFGVFAFYTLAVSPKGRVRFGVPLTLFISQWKSGDLQQEVRRYVPHLFSQNGA